GKFRSIDRFLERAVGDVGDSLLRGCHLNRGLGRCYLRRAQHEQRDRCNGDPVTNLNEKASYPAHMRAGQYTVHTPLLRVKIDLFKSSALVIENVRKKMTSAGGISG